MSNITNSTPLGYSRTFRTLYLNTYLTFLNISPLCPFVTLGQHPVFVIDILDTVVLTLSLNTLKSWEATTLYIQTSFEIFSWLNHNIHDHGV